MLARIRAVFAHSWVARILAAVLVVAFGAWGIQGALTGGGPGPQDVATVAGHTVTVDDFENAYQRALEQTAQDLSRQQGTPVDPGAMAPEMRREVGTDTLRRLVSEQVIVARAGQLGLSVPDGMVRDAILSLPQFKGPDGGFDRAKFDQLLTANHLTEARLATLIRSELMARGLIEPIHAAVTAPEPLVRTLFDYGAETRTIDLATIAFAAIAAPPSPDDAVLRRFYVNHPKLFTTEEYRKIRAVVLSPETVGRDITVSEADIRAEYDREAPTLVKPAKRSVQVVIDPDQAKAAAIASFWRGGAQWAQVQALAGKQGASAIALANAAQREFPSPKLGEAVFAANVGDVTGPTRDEAGWVVLRVLDAQAGSGSYATEHDRIRDEIARARAASVIQDRIDRLQDAIAGGGLDKIPADLGAEAAEGTLDAQGDTQTGEQAPLPASGGLRQAIVARAFAELKGAPPELEQGPDGGWYAVEVLDITPASRRPFDAARADVLKAWQQDQIRHDANARATALYVRAKQDHALAAAASAAGVAVAHPAPFRRGGRADGVPPQIVTVAFSLKTGDATMVGTPDGYAVAVVTDVGHPAPSSEQAAYDRLKQEVRQAIGDDLEIAYASHLEAEMKPSLNQAVIQRLLAP